MSKRTIDDMLANGKALQKELVDTLKRQRTIEEERKKTKKDLLKTEVWAVRVTCKYYTIPTSYYRSKKDADAAVVSLEERFLRRDEEKGMYIFKASKATEGEYEKILERGFSDEEDNPAYNQCQAFVIYMDEKKETIEHIVLMPANLSLNLFDITPIIDPHRTRLTWKHNFIYSPQHCATENEFLDRLKMILDKNFK